MEALGSATSSEKTAYNSTICQLNLSQPAPPDSPNTPQRKTWGKKSRHSLAVAQIFRSHAHRGTRHADEPPESDSDSVTSEAGRSSQDKAPVNRGDLKELLHNIKRNMAAELTKHLAPIREGLEDLTSRTLAVEDKMEEISTTTSNHDRALQELREQV
ncbi:Hypothetical predicted protein [Pelobates cultripes]|uniref:Uncharacterized protein n=1 Tax=Pelobates cultripes TaxID=61616 RepID=A0AAD1T6K3_PELCU|nr:Hypothetical predicted protein [Pelobates cultripes]